MGRPKWIPPDLKEVERIAENCLTEKQIAQCLGICRETLVQKKKVYLDFSDAIKRGQARTVKCIANKMVEQAKDGNITAGIFLLKTKGGFSEKTNANVDEEGPIEVRISYVN